MTAACVSGNDGDALLQYTLCLWVIDSSLSKNAASNNSFALENYLRKSK